MNCRKMEENVFPKVEVLLDEFVMCQLYVDEDVLLNTPNTVVVPTSDGTSR